jgi:hypothetical protein
MDYDLLLRWVSERAEGSTTSFRQAYDWLSQADEKGDHWTWALQSLQALGHLEIDWTTRHWEVAPPTIATIAGGGEYALLCGARPGWFMRRLWPPGIDGDVARAADGIVLERPVPQKGGPSLRLVKFGEKDAAEVCARLGVQYSPLAGDQLLSLLPRLTLLIRAGLRSEAALPGGVFPTRMGAGVGRQPLFEEMENPLENGPGAYCMTLFDTKRYFFVHKDGSVFESGRGEVVYMELCRRDQNVLRWDGTSQSLLVPARFRLPQLYERAAVLRTGLLPTTFTDEQSRATWLRYRNIDQSFARLLSRQLFQKLEEIARPQVPHSTRRSAALSSGTSLPPQTRQANLC